MYDDEEDQQNSERSDNPDEIGSDPSMLVLSPQKVHTGGRAVEVPWQDQSLSLEFFGVPLPPTPTTAIRVERFSFIYLGWSIRFRLLSHLALILSQPINFLSLRNVSRLDLGRIHMPFDVCHIILRIMPCLTHSTFLPLFRPEPMSHIDVSHIIPRSHIHARKPYFPPLTHSLGLFCWCGFLVWPFLIFGFGMTNFLLAFLGFYLFGFFYFFLYLAQHVCQARRGRPCGQEDIDEALRDFDLGGEWGRLRRGGDCGGWGAPKAGILEIGDDIGNVCQAGRGRAAGRAEIDEALWNFDLAIGDDNDKFLCDDDFEIGQDIAEFSCGDDFEIGDLSENVGSLNDLICLPRTTEMVEGRIEPTWPEHQSANPALEQHMAILPHTVPHVMTRNNAVTVTTLQVETDKSSLLSPQCLSGSIAQDNLAQSCPVPTLVTMEECFLEVERCINSSIELPCSNPALKLPTVTTAQGSAEEERYGKIINPSMELYSSPQCIEIPQLAGPALQPDAFPNVGKIMQVDSSEQESSVRFDAANIGGNVVSANKNCTTTCSQKKITITELLPLIGLTREAAAEKIGVSIPTFKRQCRLNSIFRWPHYRNKKQCRSLQQQCRSLQQKLAVDSDQGAAGAFGHFVTGSHTGAIGSNHHNSPCSKPAKRQREKKTSPSCKTPSTVATCSDPAPAPMQAMSTFPQIMPHLRAGQDARIEISKTTDDILIQSVEGVTTRSCLSPQKRAGSDVPSTSSPKHFHCKQNARTATIKATYGDKTVRVPPPATSGIVKLKEELARRLELEHGSFYVEYEDEDHDWILIACDDVLQECLTFSRDNRVIRLAVRDEVVNSQNSGKAL